MIEPELGQERFLTDHPVRLILQDKFAKVPIMTGVTRDEFSYSALGKLTQ